jgi:hypothetical protein
MNPQSKHSSAYRRRRIESGASRIDLTIYEYQREYLKSLGCESLSQALREVIDYAMRLDYGQE